MYSKCYEANLSLLSDFGSADMGVKIEKGFIKAKRVMH